MNWYVKSKSIYSLEKNAGTKKDLLVILLSMISGGLAGFEASKIRNWLEKNNVPEQSITQPVGKTSIEDLTKEDVQILISKENGELNKLPTSMPSEKYLINMIKKHEGYKKSVYTDSKGNPTIGIGFNLNRKDAPTILKNLGLNYDDILTGKQILTDQQIEELLLKDLNIAISDAKLFVPNFNELPTTVKSILIDMSFNMGYQSLSGFSKLRYYLIKKDYSRAAREMINSAWFYEVGNRSRDLVEMMNYISLRNSSSHS